MLDPSLSGKFDKPAVLKRLEKLNPNELASIAERCICTKGCKFRKCADSDAAW